MRVLIIKTSSMGDIIHTLPALTDATRAIQDIRFDWVVEDSFVDIPAWHSAVDTVIPVSLRRWRKQPFKAVVSGEWKQFRQRLREHSYDYVIDAQGLIKSAFICKRARGQKHGFDKASAREGLASRAYDVAHFIPRKQHAVQRLRRLFANALRYSMPDRMADYGVSREHFKTLDTEPAYAIFLHATTWPSKHWPVEYWQQLAHLVTAANITVYLPWGNEQERLRAEQIAQVVPQAHVLSAMSLNQLATRMAAAHFVVGIDTGLAHLTAALGVPSVTLYGSTRADLTGTLGACQVNLEVDFDCAPCMKRECAYQGSATVSPACYQTLPAEKVWDEVQSLLTKQADES